MDNNTENKTVLGYFENLSNSGIINLINSSNYHQLITGVQPQTIKMPVTSTLSIKQSWLISNNSDKILTVQSSGADDIVNLPSRSNVVITCISQSGDTRSDWNVE